GDPPAPVWTALAILRLRLRCRFLGIASIKTEAAAIAIKFGPQARLSRDAIKLLTFAFRGHRFTADGVVVPLKGPKVLPQVEEMMNVLERALAPADAAADAGHNGAGAREVAAAAPAGARGF
ncbi:MAG TPA: hypothetical protein VGS41_07655, partial [Chthonomonadales bacterium]|nr:hypothetical protein [Chthonomonadales bacterium]